MKNLSATKQPTSHSANNLLVGVTGGIGSGKSTVCKLFAQLGRTVLSADDIARKLADTSDEIKSAIRRTFGDEVFSSNGLVDRKALATVVFNDQSHRRKLDAIIHPHVFATIDSEIKKLPASKLKPYIIIEAALIYESGMDERLDYVVVVNAEEAVRIKRVMDRDGTTREAVVARMQSQMDPKQKAEFADFVIENDGSEEELHARVKFIDTLLSLMKRQE